LKSSDAKASKCHLKFSSFFNDDFCQACIFKLSLTKIIIKDENFKWHLEAFASELFNCSNDDKKLDKCFVCLLDYHFS